MKNETFRRGLKRIGLVGILGAGLMFGEEAKAGSDGEYIWKLNSVTTKNPSEKRVYDIVGTLVGRQEELDAEDAAKKMNTKLEANIEKNTGLLEEIKKQQRKTQTNTKKTNYSSLPVNSSREGLEKRWIDRSPNTDMFFTYQYYADKNNDDAKWKQATSQNRIMSYPEEFEGLGITKIKLGESFAFGAIFNQKKNSMYYFRVLYNGKEFFSKNELISRDKVITYYEFEKGTSSPGEYTAEWGIDGNPESVGRNKIIIE